MTWIALADQKAGHFCAEGLSRMPKDGVAPEKVSEQVLARGSILLETRVSPDDRPQILFGFERPEAQDVRLTMQALPGGGLSLVHASGADIVHGVVNHDSASVRADILRVTYSWDMAHDWARLVVERPEANRSFQTTLTGPVEMRVADIRDMTLNESCREMAPGVLFVAVSDRIEPIGPMPGMIGATPVETPFGLMPMGDMQRGDVVETLGGAQVPVLQVIRRTVPARGLFEPVRLRRPYFGLDHDTVVAPYQRVVIGGSRVEYLFSAEQVLVPARHLVNGSAAVRERDHLLVTYTQLLLPDHQAILANGTYMESLNIGRIRRKKDILASSLLGPIRRDSLPEHSVPAYPVLSSFEALILAEQRAA